MNNNKPWLSLFSLLLSTFCNRSIDLIALYIQVSVPMWLVSNPLSRNNTIEPISLLFGMEI